MEPFRWRNSFNPRSRNTLVHWGNGASHQDDVTNNNGLGYTDSLVDMNEIARNENVWLLVHRVPKWGSDPPYNWVGTPRFRRLSKVGSGRP